MFGIKEIIRKVINNEPLTEKDKFKFLRHKRIDSKVLKYVVARLKTLHIEILGDYEGPIIDLMHEGLLEGWCWQTTESAIIFFNDNDYIERGYLAFDKKSPLYYHSWICFKYDNIEYVFDPCLNLLCKKDDYTQIFEIEVKGKVTAKDVKDELIKQINNEDIEIYQRDETSWKRFFSEYYLKYRNINNDEVVVYGPEDVNTPFYRNGAGYKVEFQDNKIRKLTVHYYYTD